MHSRFIALANSGKRVYEEMENLRTIGIFSKLKKFNFDNKDEAALKVEVHTLYRDPEIPAYSDCKNLITILYYCAQADVEDKTILYHHINKVTFKNAALFTDFVNQAKDFLQLSDIEIKNIPSEVKPYVAPSTTATLADAFRRLERADKDKNTLKASTDTTIDALKKEVALLLENRELQNRRIAELNEKQLKATETELNLLQKINAAQEKNEALLKKITEVEGKAERKITYHTTEIFNLSNQLKAKDITNRCLTEKLNATTKENSNQLRIPEPERLYPAFLHRPTNFPVRDNVVIQIDESPTNTTLTHLKPRKK